MKNTLIEWAHHTVNFWWGCTKVSPACEKCYAETMAKLFSRGKASWGPKGARWMRDIKAVHELQQIHCDAGAKGVRERVFVNSMSDTFEDRDDLNDARKRLFLAAELSINIDVLLLTKRPENVRRMVPEHWLKKWPKHVWIGTTVENDHVSYSRVWELVNVPADVRFLSMEPLREAVDIRFAFDPVGYVSCGGEPECSCNGCRDCRNWPWDDFCEKAGIHWVIVGGESGPGARPMHPDWVRDIRDACEEYGVAFFFKQWGEWKPCERAYGKISVSTPIEVRSPKNPALHEWDDGSYSARVGKAAAGRELDGVIHSEVPEVRS